MNLNSKPQLNGNHKLLLNVSMHLVHVKPYYDFPHICHSVECSMRYPLYCERGKITCYWVSITVIEFELPLSGHSLVCIRTCGFSHAPVICGATVPILGKWRSWAVVILPSSAMYEQSPLGGPRGRLSDRL